MKKKTLRLDLGDSFEEARQYARDNVERTLAEFLKVYHARFLADKKPSSNDLKLPLSRFTFQPIAIKEKEESVTITEQRADRSLRATLDSLWQEELARQEERTARGEPAEYSKEISENEAVRTAYDLELEAIADYLKHGQSVLISCDKMLTEYIYDYVCARAGRKVIRDTDPPRGSKASRAGMAERLMQALEGGQNNPLAYLPIHLHNLRPNEVLVLRSLDMLDSPPLIELLYQRTGQGDKPQLLAFLDPSLEVQKVLTDRFAVHIGLMGLPRYIPLGQKKTGYTVSHLLTRAERACFAPNTYDPEGLYKNVAGLNAIQFRNAMQYVGAKVAPNSEPNKIYRHIRQFKISSSDEIDIPDTTFDDIGGYDEVKQQLQRIITLIAGPIEGISEKQRGQLIPRGFIFHGPPGTGKTLFAKAIANELNATIQMISGPEIMDKYVGQSENNLRRVFATARRNAPAVIFFDEFDSLASQRSTYSDGGSRANNAVVAQLLTELDGFRQEQAVLVIGTTNRIDIIDEALLRPSRLRPIEVGLPDFAARQRVAEIHAKNFGVDKLLKDLCALTLYHLDEKAVKGDKNGEQKIPQPFLDTLFEIHPAHKLRYDVEDQRAGFLRDVQGFFAFIRQTQSQTEQGVQTGLLEDLRDRLQKMGQSYGLDLTSDDLPNLNVPEAETWLLPMQSDIRDLFTLLLQEKQKQTSLTPETFLASLMNLIAEYTLNFNNDEIRAVFQEASLEHHMEGQLITPRYLGQKIGLIRKRRDEREAVHLSERGGRR